MTRVIAAIDNSAAATPVLDTARMVAELLDADVEAVHVRERTVKAAAAAAAAADVPFHVKSGSTAEGLREATSPRDVAAVVLGARSTPAGRRPVGSTALEVITTASKPVIVVPPDKRPAANIDSILVPLDASPATAAALAGTIELARRSKIAVVVLHVRDEASLHPFSDQPQHEARAWAEEFVARYCPCPLEEVDLNLRVGIPREQIGSVVEETGADLIVIGWSQTLEPGRADVVRETLTRSPVPVMLLPVSPLLAPPGGSPSGRGPG
jgi:nucleotide-binding universal stress UspA family protein